MPKTKRYAVGLSAEDLRAIAKLLERSEKLLWDKDGLFKMDVFPGAASTGEFKLPVLRPGGYRVGSELELDHIGHKIADDGWMSFIPLGEVETS